MRAAPAGRVGSLGTRWWDADEINGIAGGDVLAGGEAGVHLEHKL